MEITYLCAMQRFNHLLTILYCVILLACNNHQQMLGQLEALEQQNGTVAHNHGQSYKGMSKWELKELNGLPSQADIDDLIRNNKKSGVIYNETTGSMCPYDRYSKTQEEWLQEHDCEYEYE